jgi:hypothetical protein
METGNSVTVADIRLPAISRHRTFKGTFDVAPPESGDFGYGIIMGISMMDEQRIDQSRTTKMITWGELETPMVPSGYWTDARIQTVCKVADAKVLDSFLKNKENEEAISKIKSTDKSATISDKNTNLFSTTNKAKEASFTKAVHETPDLFEVAKRDGSNLSSEQQMMLLNVLLKNADQGRTRILQWRAGWHQIETGRQAILGEALPDCTKKLGGYGARARSPVLDRISQLIDTGEVRGAQMGVPSFRDAEKEWHNSLRY